MAGSPKISVCIPSYNQERFLPKTLDSALGQSFRDFEILIVDDGSTDNSLEIDRHYAARHPELIKVFTHPDRANHGISVSTNLALQNARGDFIVILDSDDLWFSDTLERRLRLIESRPNIGLVCSHHDLINEKGDVICRMAAPDITDDCRSTFTLTHRMILGCDIGNPTVMVRRQCLENMELFDPKLLHGDWEIWTRVASNHRAAFLKESTALHRRHEHNVTGHHSMEMELDRRMAVMNALLRKAPATGGSLALPRLRALIQLEMCSYYFCLYQRNKAAASLIGAIQTDHTLFTDNGRYFTTWLIQRPHLPQPRNDFHAWIFKLLRDFFGANSPSL